MPARVQQEVLQRLDRLIADGNRVLNSYRNEHRWSRLGEHEVRGFVAAVAAEVVRIAGRESEHYRQLAPPPADGRPFCSDENIPAAAFGVLSVLREAVAGGHLETLAARVRAALHDDLLEQATELLAGGYHVAAVVLIGGVLEQRLRQLHARLGGAAIARPSLSAFNDALRDRDGAYGQATWRQIQVVGDVRNHAAHGEYAQVQRAQVDEALAFVRRFLAEHEA